LIERWNTASEGRMSGWRKPAVLAFFSVIPLRFIPAVVPQQKPEWSRYSGAMTKQHAIPVISLRSIPAVVPQQKPE